MSLQLNSPVCPWYSAKYIWCPVVSGKGNSQYLVALHGECQQPVAVFLCCLNSGKGLAGSQVCGGPFPYLLLYLTVLLS